LKVIDRGYRKKETSSWYNLVANHKRQVAAVPQRVVDAAVLHRARKITILYLFLQMELRQEMWG